MTLYEEHQENVRLLKERHKQELADLDTELKAEQANCSHKWVRHKDLFYALGETADGDKCSECSAQRHVP